MCLLTIAHRVSDEFPLVVAANRDESYARPTELAHFWAERPDILAGRDLEAGGTWLGVNRRGWFAAVTNFRELGRRIADAPSRGHLVSDFLLGNATAAEHAHEVAKCAQSYNGFNLLLLDDHGLWYLSNRSPVVDAAPKQLPPGIYGLSNHLLDTPWPKLIQAKRRFADAIAQGSALEGMMAILGDRELAADDALPDTGIGAGRERLLSSIFIASDIYGTRCSTLLAISRARRARLIEQNFTRGGVATDAVDYRFGLNPAAVTA